MRLANVWILLGWATIHAAVDSAAGDEAFPFRAQVIRDRCAVRSGPGDENYITDHVQRGEEVDVYKRVAGGWLAIRPPQTSFSWVAERNLTQTAVSDVASVVGDSAVSWIGSSVGDVADHKWLVKLEEGEPVTVLGKKRLRLLSSGKSDVYYKIAPPAGEFRWVHEDDVALSSDEPADRDEHVELADFRVSLRGSPRKAEGTVESSNASPFAAAPQPLSVDRNSNGKAAAGTPSRTAPRRDDFTRRGLPPAAARPAKEKDRPRTARLEKRQAAAPAILSEPADLETSIRDLDAMLSLAVAQPVETWEFASLRRSADQLSQRATTTLERARIQIFVDKLDDFEALKSRHALLAPAAQRPAARLGAPEVPQLKSGEPAGEIDPNDIDPRFDGTGWLLPVHSTKPSAPPYALLDKEGNILQFVSPAPGLNLNRYLRKEIGVFGQKEQSSTAEKPHLTAHRVVELDRHRTRR